MTDRAKVINDLNTAKLILRNPQMLTPEMCVRIGQTIISAIDLLKEQEAVKPIKPIYQGDDSYNCDNCGETVGWEEMECYGIGKIRYKYCPGCGRKVKWDENRRMGK